MQRLINRAASGRIRRRFAASLIQDSTIVAPASQFNIATRLQSDAPPSRYAVVDHSEAYEASMEGSHGRQLALARLEGQGKDDPPFDPFTGEEMGDFLEEEEIVDHEGGEDDEEYGDDVIEAQYASGDDEEKDDADEYEDHEDGEDEDDGELSVYNRNGSIRRPKSVLATLRAGFPAGGQFAVIEMAGAQHKVTTDDLIVVNRLKPLEKYAIGTVHTLTDVLLVGSSHKTLVGMPTVPGAEVDVMVEEITRDAKIIIFKKRRRKNSQRKNGFRRDITLLRVLDVRMPDEYKDHKHIGREIVDELAAEQDKQTAGAFNANTLPNQALANEQA